MTSAFRLLMAEQKNKNTRLPRWHGQRNLMHELHGRTDVCDLDAKLGEGVSRQAHEAQPRVEQRVARNTSDITHVS